MDPLLSKLVEAKRHGVKLPVLVMHVDGMVVVGHLDVDQSFIDDAREHWAHLGEPTLADELGLDSAESSPQYVTVTQATLTMPPLQRVDVPSLRVNLEHVSAWSFRIDTSNLSRDD